jgi:hypothetical protein|tara:strand:+ start:5173 stop:5460 length:288 start_codon:yes stop_codon:yes gene_type:complete
MINPKCLNGEQCYGFNIDGYLLPCCWVDHPTRIGQFKILTKDKFKLSNVDSIESIIESEEWQEFFDVLINKPEEAPETCKHYCSDRHEHRKISYS